MAPGEGEFDVIARLFRPLTGGSPEALDLLDDVALLSCRPGSELVVTTDAMVQGVHFLSAEPLDLVARKLLRANLSDLAAKAAEPHGYLLTIAWPHGTTFQAKACFAAGLATDQERYGVRLLGGDTVSTAGPLTASLTLLGWTPVGGLLRRGGARAGDVLLVSGTIGDAGLGLQAMTGGLTELDAGHTAYLVDRHRLPTPRLKLREALRAYASAAADVSDGLLADANHIAQASGLAVCLELERLPLSPAAAVWLGSCDDRAAAILALASSGDDYEVVCTARPEAAQAFIQAAANAGSRLASIGRLARGGGIQVSLDGQRLAPEQLGWSHPT